MLLIEPKHQNALQTKMSLQKSTLNGLLSHAQLQMIYEKYRQALVLKELEDDAPRVSKLFKPTIEELEELRKVCPHSFLLRVYSETNK